MLERTNADSGQLRLTLSSSAREAAPPREILRVSELNGALQRLLESNFNSIWVAGEISGCRTAASGHYYFVLKDAESQLKAVLFKGNARYARQKPQDGLSVLARGSLQVYEARGEYQLIVELLEPQGAGALQLAFEELKKRLGAEGAFDSARKRPLPVFPKRIGIVTSAAGAVIRDILHVLERRFPGLHVRLCPAAVQGEGSVTQVCQGLQFFSAENWADVVIVARGGGSLEDLWTFNEEAVARAVLASRPPVISAIGHETDFTICDFVADLRAPTPSAAAELVIGTRESLQDQFDAAARRAGQALRYRLMRCHRDLHQRGTDSAATIIHRTLGRHQQRVDEIDGRARDTLRLLVETRQRRWADLHRRLEANDLQLRFARVHSRVDSIHNRLQTKIRQTIVSKCRRHDSLAVHLEQISPLTVLSRGYAIVQNAAGEALRDAVDAEVGQSLRVRLHHGQIGVVVQSTTEEAAGES